MGDWYQTAQNGRAEAMRDYSRGRRMTVGDFRRLFCSEAYVRAYNETYDFHVAQLDAPLNAADRNGPCPVARPGPDTPEGAPMSTETSKPRCNRLLSVDPLGTPREYCWRAEGHPGPCPRPTRGNAVDGHGATILRARAQSGR